MKIDLSVLRQIADRETRKIDRVNAVFSDHVDRAGIFAKELHGLLCELLELLFFLQLAFDFLLFRRLEDLLVDELEALGEQLTSEFGHHSDALEDAHNWVAIR